MNDSWNLVLGIASPVVTIVGLIFAYLQIKKQIIAETIKQKQQVALEKMAELPYKLQSFYKEVSDIEKPQAERTKMVTALMETIFAYGSADAIKIAATLQQLSYQKQVEKNPMEYMAVYILLAAQIKYDVMGVLVKPSAWFKLKLTDYYTVENQLAEINKDFVIRLNLNKDFIE